MSFPRYPEYRDSGVEWLGEVPKHWQIVPLKRDLAFLTSGSRGWAEHYSDDGALFIRIGNLTRYGIHLDLSDIQRVAVPEGAEGERTKVLAGDVLFSITAYLGSVAVAPDGLETAYVSQHVALARLNRQLFLPIWVGYVVLSYVGRTYLETQGYGGTKIQLSLEDVANIIVMAPPLSEQSVIGAFLDCQTSKIDALVAEQVKLIALLKEKRQAVISHAVTKGLNPDASMKDSGIEWLGAVPQHWRTGKIHYFARLESGHTPSRQHPEYWEHCTIPWFSLADVWQIREGRATYVFETNELISEVGLANSSARLLPKGTVILSRTASVGFSTIMGCDMATTQDFANWVCGSDLLPEFLLSVFRGMGCEFDRLMMGSTHQTIYMPDIAKLALAVPPLSEQTRIVTFLDQQTAKLDALTAEAERAIDLLKERRSALISAAVTGKIDVRGLVDTEAA
jgi:type I restriction enzyme S subunit